MALRASVVIAAQPDVVGSDALVLIDGSDTAVTAGGLDGYVPTPGDRLLVDRVGYQVEILQFLTRGTPPNADLAFPLQVGEITIDETGGITVPNPSGTPTQLPADGSEAVFAGAVRTGDLTVDGGLTINGAENDVNGTLRLSNSFRNPTLGPGNLRFATSPYTGTIPSQGSVGWDTWSLTRSLTGTGEWATTHFPTGAVDRYSSSRTLLSRWLYTGWTVRGVVAVSGWYYAIAQKWEDNDWYVLKIHSTGVLQATPAPKRAYTDTGGLVAGGIPAIGHDGSGGIMVSAVTSDAATATLNVRRYDSDLVQVGTNLTLTIPSSLGSSGAQLQGVGMAKIGPAGETRIWVLRGYEVIRNGSNGFAGGTADRVIKSTTGKGLHFDDPLGTGVVYAHMLNPSTYDVEMMPVNYFPAGGTSVCYTWYDNDGTTHETAPGPVTTLWPSGDGTVDWRYVCCVAEPPPDDGTADAPNSVRFYVKKAGGAWVREATDTAAPYLATIVAGQGTVADPPVTSTFPNASAQPGFFASEALHDYGDGEGPVSRFRVDGAGNGRWDQIVVDPDGVEIGEVQITGRVEDSLTFLSMRGDPTTPAATIPDAAWTNISGIFPTIDAASAHPDNDGHAVGIYLVIASAAFRGGGTGRRLMRMRLNGVEKVVDSRNAATGTSDEEDTVSVTWTGRYDPNNDTMVIEVYQTSGGGSLDIAASTRNIWQVVRLTGRT